MPDEDKSADPVSEKAQAFKENLIRIVTVFAYASSVSMAALCLSSYYVFFWEPKPPGPGPPVIVPHANAYMAAEPYPPLKLVGLPSEEEEKDGASFWQSVWSYMKPDDATTLAPTIVTFTTTKRYSTTPKIEPYNFTALMSDRNNNSSLGYASVNISDILSIPEQTRVVIPEKTRAVIPEQTRSVIPEQARAVIPDQTRAVITEQTRAGIPEQTRVVIPGHTGGAIHEQTRGEDEGHDEPEAEHEEDYVDDTKEIDVRDRKRMMSGYLGIIPDRRSKRGMETVPDRSKRGMETIHVKEDHEGNDDDVIHTLRQVVNTEEDEEIETERDEEEENEYFKEGINQKEETKESDSTKTGSSGEIIAQIDKEDTGKVEHPGNIVTMMVMEGKPKIVEAKIGTGVTTESERDTNEKIKEVKEIRNTELTSTTKLLEKHGIEHDETKPKLDEIDKYNSNKNRRLESKILGEHVRDTTETTLTKMEKPTTNLTISTITTRTIGTQSTIFKLLNTISSTINPPHTQKVEHKRELGTLLNIIQAKKEIFNEDKINKKEKDKTTTHENNEEIMTTVTLKETSKQEDKPTTNSDMATTNQNKLPKVPILEQTTQGNKLKTVSDIKEMEVVALEQSRTFGINMKTNDDGVIGENTTKPSIETSKEIEKLALQNKTQEESISPTKQGTVEDVNDLVNFKDKIITHEADTNDNDQDSTTELDLEQITPQGDRIRPDFTQYQHHQRQLRPRKKFPSA